MSNTRDMTTPAVNRVYFLEVAYEKSREYRSKEDRFFVGPYQTAEEANRRRATVKTSLTLPAEICIREMKAKKLDDEQYIVAGRRLFGSASFVSVDKDGSLGKNDKELHLPSDYFDLPSDCF